MERGKMSEKVAMRLEDHLCVDWKGDPVKKGRHGGNRAAFFIYFMVVMTSLAFVPNTLNMVTYFRDTMHMGVAASSITANTLTAGTSAAALIGGFLSDSYITRFRAILIFGPILFLGFSLLALQAHLPQLQPPKCSNVAQVAECQQVDGYKAVLLYTSMCILALGEGCLRANLPSLGADQFDSDNPTELRQKSSFFNWYGFCYLLGMLPGFIVTVWVANKIGWEYGFTVSAGAALLGILVFSSAFSIYRVHRPLGSPLSRILQVFTAAFRNRKLAVSKNDEELLQELLINPETEEEIVTVRKDFKWLNKACISHENHNSCSLSQVEETKTLLRMLPIFLCVVVCYMPVPQLATFSVQQGNTMDNKVGPLEIQPASLLIIPVLLQMFLLVAYDRAFVPFARKITGCRTGITSLQRVGVGCMSISTATLAAGVVEWKRKQIAEEHGLVVDTETRVPMSVLWLGIPFLGVGFVEVFMFVGLLEFFHGEVSRGMKTMGSALAWCVVGLGSLTGALLVKVVNRLTRLLDGGSGWLEGKNLNRSHLDRYYWLLTALAMSAFFSYLYFAKTYLYKKNPYLA